MTNFTGLANPQLGAPATPDALAGAERALGFELPGELKRVLSQANGWTDETSLHFYSCEALGERNATWEVAIYAPAHVAIADDGGGRIALVARAGADARVYVTGSGDMDPNRFVLAGRSLDAWIDAGCPFDQHRAPAPAYHLPVDVFLIAPPPNGLRDLSRLRQVWNLEVPISELKARAQTLPCLIVRGVSRAFFEARMRELPELSGLLEARPPGSGTE